MRGGDRESRAARSKLGANDGRVALYIEELFENIAPRRNDYYLSELCRLVKQRFDVSVFASTMHAFLARLDISRKRLVRLLPRQALTEKNVAWRKQFVQQWFAAGTYDLDAVRRDS